MKYMGSKTCMLKNGLGSLILENAPKHKRIVDLFCGASSISWFAAENTDRRVLAVDLQSYAIQLAKSILMRNSPADFSKLQHSWLKTSYDSIIRSKFWKKAVALQNSEPNQFNYIRKSRELCRESSGMGPVWNSYGGYYFSPKQAIIFDYLIANLPEKVVEKSVCLAAILSTAVKCAASPGHTAQPFSPTKTAIRFILDSWRQNPLEICEKYLIKICRRFAQVIGEAYQANAVDFASNLTSSDLVIIDPPYSGVQYSRFYHVLETMSNGKCSPVSGSGRYPPIAERPQSDFSNKGTSKRALITLLSKLGEKGSTVIFTFPEKECSNGLSGKFIREVAQDWFSIKEKVLISKFSTLGGNNNQRASRINSPELLMLMTPK